MSAPLAAGPASGLGQPSRGSTSRSSVSPKLSIARAALPMFCPSWAGPGRRRGRGQRSMLPRKHSDGLILVRCNLSPVKRLCLESRASANYHGGYRQLDEEEVMRKGVVASLFYGAVLL